MVNRLDGDTEPLYSEVCLLCAHFHQLAFVVEGVHKCDAFDAIPDSIWRGDNLHREPVKGDDGITYRALVIAGV